MTTARPFVATEARMYDLPSSSSTSHGDTTTTHPFPPKKGEFLLSSKVAAVSPGHSLYCIFWTQEMTNSADCFIWEEGREMDAINFNWSGVTTEERRRRRENWAGLEKWPHSTLGEGRGGKTHFSANSKTILQGWE